MNTTSYVDKMVSNFTNIGEYEMESPVKTPQFQQKSNRNIIIGVVIAVVLCCCCLSFAVAGYYGYRTYLAAQILDKLPQVEIPTTIPDVPNDLPIPSDTTPSYSEAPQGGLADDSTRPTAWSAVQLIALMSGCETPIAEGTTIKVLQEPDANGEWVEEWKVNCGGGKLQPHKVTFTPENGIVNVNVEYAP
jgi:hypothetical protein